MDHERMTSAFNILLEEINQYIHEINVMGSDAFSKGDYKAVTKYKEEAHEASMIRDTLRKQYTAFMKLVPTTSPQQKKKKVREFPRVSIPVTQGAIDHNYFKVSKYLNFFPKDVIGAPNANDGEGKRVSLHLAGFTDVIETDITSDKLCFRKRGWCRDFYSMHKIKAGDEVVIEKTANYEYRIFPSHD